MNLPDDALIATLFAAMMAGIGWLLKTVSRQTVEGINAALKVHGDAIKGLAGEIGALRSELSSQRELTANHDARLEALERK